MTSVYISPHIGAVSVANSVLAFFESQTLLRH